jgi:arabinoxylan arabinofuranohydrolase
MERKSIGVFAMAFLMAAVSSCVSGGSGEGGGSRLPIPAPTAGFKDLQDGNPLMTQRFGADPWALVLGRRVYVYSTHDVLEYSSGTDLVNNSYRTIRDLNCISSDDLVNWTDHGIIDIAGDAGACSWASNSWAPAAARKKIGGKDKFFLYFANSANSIGVVTSDSPTGPWKDPLGEPLISRSTENCADVTWLFDPAVLVDDDGKAYIYFGGGVPTGKDENPLTARVAMLGDDMTSLASVPQTIDAPYFFEDSGINKVDGVYYYSYCSNWASRGGATGPYVPGTAEIAYMTSATPLGPFQYQGTFLRNPGSYFGLYGNNHHSLVEFDGRWLVFYHAEILRRSMELKANGYRSVNVNDATAPKGGAIDMVEATMGGAAMRRNLSPYTWTEAETMAWMAGIDTEHCAEESPAFGKTNLAVTGIDPGDWIGLSAVDFGKIGASKVTVKAASSMVGGIEIRLDSPEGEAIGYLDIQPTGGDAVYKTMTARIKRATGVRNLFFVFAGSGYRLDGWRFGK